jgi:eukaryotic-like serine/threonine-protein kinase
LGKVESSYRVARFEGFELDLRAGELCREGDKPVSLAEQPFRILAMLLEHHGDLVTREEIREALWPNGTIVEFEHSISAAINRLRQVLGDSAEEPHYIETLARRGYRWRVKVEWVERHREGAEPAKTEAGPEARTSFDRSLIGKKVSHYRVLEVLGGGGMGVVYKAEDLKLGRRVALKFLPEELANDAKAMERFEQEARAASALNHPNICTIYEVEEHEGQPFIVMELLEGQTLRELMSAAEAAAPGTSGRKEFLPLETLLHITTQIAEGLDAAHKKGVIHRDIKPANIFVTSNGQVKILDFGLAKLGEPDTVVLQSRGSDAGPAQKVMNLNLTVTGVAMGTAGYMSPEQVRGEKLDARTDLFSFGLVVYEMAAGQRAFTGETASVVRTAILNHPPRPVRELNPEIPAKLEMIINRALEKERKRRYQSASEMRTDLARLKRDTDLSLGIAEPTLGSDFCAAAPAPAAALSSARAIEARGAASKKGRGPLVVSTAVVVGLAIVASAYFFTHRTPKLTSKDPIILADFINTTGDAVFDGTLRQGLASQLEQSPYLDVLSDEQIAGTLRLMAQPAGTRLTHELARQVCQRTEGAAVLDGSIAQIGSQYNLVLNAENCSTGARLASAQAVASDKNHVLSALGSVASTIREKLGESLSSIQKFNSPLEEVTTSSIEALQAYTIGWQAHLKGDQSADGSFQRAISLDPNFAMAYAALGTAESSRKAYDLRDRVSERERFYISSHYEADVTGDLEKAIQIYNFWAQTYPRDVIPLGHLSWEYAALGRYDESLTAARRALELGPDFLLPYEVLTESYLDLDRLDEAATVLQQAKARGIDSPSLHQTAYQLAFLGGDAVGMAREEAWGTGKPRHQDGMADMEMQAAAYTGHIGDADDFTARLVASAVREKEGVGVYLAEAALRQALVGNLAKARRQASAALQASGNQEAPVAAALALALAGNTAKAQQLAELMAKRSPQDTLIQFNYMPTIRAAIALGQQSPAEAIGHLQAAAPYELGDMAYVSDEFLALCPVYVRGEAYLAAHRGSEARAEFQKILDHRGIARNGPGPIGALAHLQIGRAYAMQGDTASAKAAYQDFLSLWKDADPDLPILQLAKAEFAGLR